MSAIVTVPLNEMTEQDVICRVLNSRLGNQRENGSTVSGSLHVPNLHDWQDWVTYDKANNAWSFDGDNQEAMENHLKELYQVEKAKMVAEQMGVSYEEVMDPNTGQISLSDDNPSVFDQMPEVIDECDGLSKPKGTGQVTIVVEGFAGQGCTIAIAAFSLRTPVRNDNESPECATNRPRHAEINWPRVGAERTTKAPALST